MRPSPPAPRRRPYRTEPLVPEAKSNKPTPANAADGSDPFAYARRVLATLDAYPARYGPAWVTTHPWKEPWPNSCAPNATPKWPSGRQMQWVAEDDAKRREAAQLIVALQQPL